MRILTKGDDTHLMEEISMGVTQGSLLSPTFCYIYIDQYAEMLSTVMHAKTKTLQEVSELCLFCRR